MVIPIIHPTTELNWMNFWMTYWMNWIIDAVSTPAPTIVDDDSFEKELCKAKEAGEWFRLVAGDGDNCRDVIQCTSSVNRKIDKPMKIGRILIVDEYIGIASHPLSSRSGFRHWEADVRLERAGEKLSDQGEGAQSQADPVHRRAALPGRNVGLSRRHLHRAQPLL